MNLRNKLAAIVLSVVASASALSAQIDDLRYRVEAGITSSQITNFGIGKPLTGFRVAGYVVLPFEYTHFAINTGLILTNKGEQSKFYQHNKQDPNKVSVTENSQNLRLYYLQLPVEASLRLDFSKDFKTYFSFGPYFAYGVGGSAKADETGETFKLLSGADKAFNNFEWGLNLNIALAYKDFYIKGALEYSMNDAIKNASKFPSGKIGKARHGLAALTVGYQF